MRKFYCPKNPRFFSDNSFILFFDLAVVFPSHRWEFLSMPA